MEDLKKTTVDDVIKFLESIEWMFGVQNYEKKVVTLKEDEDEKAAEITFDEPYQTIQIRLYPIFFTKDRQFQRKAIIHELCHTITIPSKTLAFDLLNGSHVTFKHITDENERMTSKIENLLDRLLNNNLKYAKEAYADFIETKKRKKKKK